MPSFGKFLSSRILLQIPVRSLALGAGMFWLSVRRRLTKRSKLPGAAEMSSRNKDRCNLRAEGQERRLVKENGLHAVREGAPWQQRLLPWNA
jgi:hypothetical protein